MHRGNDVCEPTNYRKRRRMFASARKVCFRTRYVAGGHGRRARAGFPLPCGPEHLARTTPGAGTPHLPCDAL